MVKKFGSEGWGRLSEGQTREARQQLSRLRLVKEGAGASGVIKGFAVARSLRISTSTDFRTPTDQSIATSSTTTNT